MQKRVVVHVGPPKTGTSAIQYWFAKHASLLPDIYYPSHKVDKNNISSGHSDLILDRADDLETFVSDTRLLNLLNKFKSRPESTLFLSSEYFYRHVIELSQKVDLDIEFLFYLRDPIERQQSSYIQGVKRHSCVESFHLAPGFKFKLLDRVAEWRNAGATVTVRPYGDQYYIGGDIILDIFSYLNMSPPKDLNRTARVNKTYSFEALEFKRLCNFFPLGKLEYKLDIALQAYSGGTQNYTLFDEGRQNKLRSKISAQMRDFVGSGNDHCLAEFLNNFENTSLLSKELCIQGEAELSSILHYLQESHGTIYHKLRALVDENSFLLTPSNQIYALFEIPFKIPNDVQSLVDQLVNERELGQICNKTALRIRDQAINDMECGDSKLAMAKLLLAWRGRPNGDRIISLYNQLALEEHSSDATPKSFWQNLLEFFKGSGGNR